MPSTHILVPMSFLAMLAASAVAQSASNPFVAYPQPSNTNYPVPAVQWAQGYQATGGATTYFMSNAVDPEGNIVVVGSTSGGSIQLSPTVFANATTTNNDNGQLIIAKFLADGTPLWIKLLGASNAYTSARTCEDRTAGLCDIATDANGNIAVTTSYTGDLVVGPITLPVGAGDYLTKTAVFKLTPDGVPIWARAISSDSSNIAPQGISTGSDGSVAVSGYFQGLVDFGGGGVSSLSLFDSSAFVAKYQGGDGAYVWADVFGDEAKAFRLQTDSLTNAVVVTGYYRATATVGTNNLPITSTNATIEALGTRNPFVIKYDAQGAALWAVGFGVEGDGYGGGVAIDNEGNVYNAGVYSFTLPTVGAGGPLIYKYIYLEKETFTALNGGTANFYYVKMNGRTGTVEWANAQNQGGGKSPVSDAYVATLALDPTNGNLLVAQTGNGPVLTSAQLDHWWMNPYFCGSSSGRPAVFVTVMNTETGKVRMQNFYGNLMQCSASDDLTGSGITFNPTTGAFHVTGSFASYIDFPPYAAFAPIGTTAEAGFLATFFSPVSDASLRAASISWSGCGRLRMGSGEAKLVRMKATVSGKDATTLAGATLMLTAPDGLTISAATKHPLKQSASVISAPVLVLPLVDIKVVRAMVHTAVCIPPGNYYIQSVLTLASGSSTPGPSISVSVAASILDKKRCTQ